MPIRHLEPDTSPDAVADALAAEGAVVVDDLASTELVDRVLDEMAPFIEATPTGPDSFAGHHTKRTGALVARSPAARELVMHPLALGATAELLGHATNYQLHLTQVISIGPGSPAQPIHRDQWAFDFFPFPKGYDVQCNTIWAGTDFTAANGATRVVVGSNTADDGLELTIDESEPAEMSKGSVLFYTGSVYHGGGPNQTDRTRVGINITYNVAWLRQEENQYLSVPREVAATLPEPLQRLLGYARGAYALGYIDDIRDPIEALRGSGGAAGFGGEIDLASVRRRLESRPAD